MKGSSLAELTKALVKFQAEMAPIKREAKNPGFKKASGLPSTYADFASTVEAIREPMAECGLAFVQLLGGDATGITVTTVLLHVSGESIQGTGWSPVTQQTPQAVGSATTYLKRYGLQAILGLATEDDDGAAGSKPKPKEESKPKEPKPVDTAAIVKAFDGLGVTSAMLEAQIGRPLSQATEADVATLKKLYAEKKKVANVTPEELARALEQ